MNPDKNIFLERLVNYTRYKDDENGYRFKLEADETSSRREYRVLFTSDNYNKVIKTPNTIQPESKIELAKRAYRNIYL